MLALGTLDTHMEKKDGWFIQGLNFASFVEQKDKKGTFFNINKSLSQIKESKPERMWPTQGEIGEINSGLIRLKNRSR